MSDPARRILHCCYCCDDADAAIALLEGAFGLSVRMRISGERSDGAILGLDRTIEAQVAFVFDARGPRSSPAIEVSGWVDPPAVGQPYAAPHHVGIQAVGIAVPNLAVAIARASQHGVAATGVSVRLFAAPCATLRDPTGIGFDLVEAAADPDAAPRLRHLRITVRDLERSVAWYEGIGFRVEQRDEIDVRGGAFGQPGHIALRAARLALPDESTALLLVQWLVPASAGTAYAEPYHRGLYRIALAVDDTRASARALEAVGYRMNRPPLSVALGGTRVPDMWIVFLDDPDGIPIELVERPRSAFR